MGDARDESVDEPYGGTTPDFLPWFSGTSLCMAFVPSPDSCSLPFAGLAWCRLDRAGDNGGGVQTVMDK